jgi:hypothetical protein
LIALILTKDYCNVKQGFARLQNRNKKRRGMIRKRKCGELYRRENTSEMRRGGWVYDKYQKFNDLPVDKVVRRGIFATPGLLP